MTGNFARVTLGVFIMFTPFDSIALRDLLSIIVTANGSQQTRIKTALQQACYLTFATDYRTAGADGAPNYDAPHFNAIMDVMEQIRGADIDAMARWIVAFAPVQIDKATGYFTINKQKVDALGLYLLDDESTRINSFWSWMIAPSVKAKALGSADDKLYAPILDWWLLDSNTKARAKAEFISSDSIKKRIDNLIKECVKAGLDTSADLLSKVESEVVAAAKIAEAKHAA